VLPVIIFQVAIPPLTLATSAPQTIAPNVSIGNSVAMNDQKKLFFDTASNLWWAFYSNGTSMLCTTSTPNSGIWAPPAVINSSVVPGSRFSLWHDDALSLLYYVSTSGGSSFHYRFGSINTAGCGAISWSIPNTGVAGADGNVNSPTIFAVDPSTIWISVTENTKTNYFIQVFLCNTTGCKSSHLVTLPNIIYESIILGTGSVTTGSSEAVLLYAVDYLSGGSPINFTYTTDGGNHWINSTYSTDKRYGGNRMSAYMIGPTVYVAAIEASPNNIFYFTYTLGGALSTETQLVNASGGVRNVDIASDGSSGLLIGYTDSVNIGYLYSQNLGSSWGGIKYLVLNGPIIYQSTLNLEKGPGSTYGMMWSEGNLTHDIEFISFVPSTPDPTATSVKCSPASFAVGIQTTCTASVSDTSSQNFIPNGNVTFSATSSGAGSFAPISCNLAVSGSTTASCAVSFATGSGDEGSITMVGTYNGDSSHGGSNGMANVTATKRMTSISVSCTPSSVPVTGRTTCTATVKDTSPGIKIALSGGNVTFAASPSSYGAFSPASAQCTPNFGMCSVTFTPGAGSMGDVTMTASYAGDADHSSSSTQSGFGLTATGVYTVTVITCFPSPDQINQGSVCTAIVSDSGGATEAPSGLVTFSTNSSAGGSFAPSSSCSLSGGLCSVTFNPTMKGTNTIQGSYGGDIDHKGSVGNFTLVVTSRNSSVSVSCTSSIQVTGSTTCTATVADFSIGVVIAPTGGTVTFTASPAGSGAFTPASGQCTTNSGTCTVTFSPSKIGNITIAASYAGDANHLSSSVSAGFSLGVMLVDTRTAVSCSPSTDQINQGSVCTATVSDSGGATERPTGNVSFSVNSPAGGTGRFSPSTCDLLDGSCSVTFTTTMTGVVTIQGSYGGDLDHTGSVGNSGLTVTNRNSSISVSCTSSSLQVTGSTACTATVKDTSLGDKVTPSGGNVTFAASPSGSGTFYPASAQCTLNSGTCTVTFSPSKIGNITIAASYAGDANHFSSASSTGFALLAVESTPSYVLLLVALDIISASVAFPIGYYSFKFNKLVGSPALRAISVGFALLGTGLLVEGLTTFITDATVVNGLLAKSLVADAGLLFLALQLIAYFTFACGYAIEIFGSSKAPFDRLAEPGTLLPVGILTSTFGAYYDITLLAYLLMVALLAFTVFEAVLVYSRSKRKSALLVLLGFGVIFGSHVLMLDSVAALTQVTFYEGTLAQFIGFTMLLWFLVRSGRFGSS